MMKADPAHLMTSQEGLAAQLMTAYDNMLRKWGNQSSIARQLFWTAHGRKCSSYLSLLALYLYSFLSLLSTIVQDSNYVQVSSNT